MNSLGMELGTFIYGVFYGNPESCANLVMRDARKDFIRSGQFSRFLANL